MDCGADHKSHYLAGFITSCYEELTAKLEDSSRTLLKPPRTPVRLPHFYLITANIFGNRYSYELSGEVEADESYFGGKRKGLRGRGAAGKVVVFGLLKRGGKVYTAIIPKAKTETLLPIIEEKVTPDSIVYTDTFQACHALDVSNFHHLRINHS